MISFARAERLDLLQKIVGHLIVPEAVYQEIVIRGEGKPGSAAILNAQWVETRKVSNRILVDQLSERLQLGEREAIALAKELQAALLLDDRRARSEAAQLNVECFGSLRLLKEARDRRFIEAVRPVLDELIAAGSYITEILYEEFLREVGEQ